MLEKDHCCSILVVKRLPLVPEPCLDVECVWLTVAPGWLEWSVSWCHCAGQYLVVDAPQGDQGRMQLGSFSGGYELP